MNTLSLVLSNDDISNSRTGQQVEDSISISALSLFIAASLRSFIALHLAIEDLTRHDVLGILENDSLLGDGELGDWEGEARRWPLAEISLGGVGVALLAIAGLGLTGVNDSGLGDGEEG